MLQRPQHKQPQWCEDARSRVEETVGKGCLSSGLFDCHSFSWRSGFLWAAGKDVLEQRTIIRAQPVPFAPVATTFPARSRGTHCDLSAAGSLFRAQPREGGWDLFPFILTVAECSRMSILLGTYGISWTSVDCWGWGLTRCSYFQATLFFLS